MLFELIYLSLFVHDLSFIVLEFFLQFFNIFISSSELEVHLICQTFKYLVEVLFQSINHLLFFLMRNILVLYPYFFDSFRNLSLLQGVLPWVMNNCRSGIILLPRLRRQCSFLMTCRCFISLLYILAKERLYRSLVVDIGIVC